MKKIIFFMLLLIGMPVHAKEAITGSITIHSAEKFKIYKVQDVSSGKNIPFEQLEKNNKIIITGLPKGAYEISGDNIPLSYITMPVSMTKKEAVIQGFDVTKGISDDTEKINFWNLNYIIDGQLRLMPSEKSIWFTKLLKFLTIMLLIELLMVLIIIRLSIPNRRRFI